MLFTSSFKLLSISALLLPALLVSASPHSLSERAETEKTVTFHECDKDSSADCEYTLEAVEITLKLLPGEVTIFTVVGDWNGTPATAESTESWSDVDRWLTTNSEESILAYGHDNGELTGSFTYYVLFKDESSSEGSSDGSEETIKGR